MSDSEVDLWSAVHLHSLVNARQIAQKILPRAVRQDDFLRDGRFIVTLKSRYVPEANQFLGRGAWVCTSEHVYGESVVDLYAYQQWSTYRQAIFAIAYEGSLVGPAGKVGQQTTSRIWVEERYPLHRDDEVPDRLPADPWATEIQTYKNLPGHNFLKVIGYRGADGQTNRVYRSLRRHRAGTACQWAEIRPQAPYPIFNAHLLRAQPNCLVVLVADEFEAAKMSQKFSDRVFSTVSDGLKNMTTADLSPLGGRQTLVVLSFQDLGEGLRIQHALERAGVTDAWFSVDEGRTSKRFAELEKIAAQRMVKLLPAPFEQVPVPLARIIIAAGERIPGGNIVRRMLIYPIIREGYLVWLFAEPKIGKTWLGLWIAYAAARGNSKVGRWHTTDPVGVLYVDGEMLPNELDESISMVMVGAGDQPGPLPFATICARCLDDGVVDINSQELQMIIEKELREKKLDLLILDNFQSLTDNGPTAFNLLRPWLLKMTQLGIAVVVLDHTNRDGDVQGSKAKERMVNLSIALRCPDDRVKEEGRFIVEFPVARRLHGADAESFQLRKRFTDRSMVFEEVHAETSNPSNFPPKVMKRMLSMALVVFAKDEEGLSYPRIHQRYGISNSTACGFYRKAGALVGEQKVAFDKELYRLKAQRVPSTSE